ncbi:MAG: GNAT family N-acetyltransferase [Gloeobacterales cyanobacterium]
MYELETARLGLRKFTLEDLEAHTAIYGNPEVTQFLPGGPFLDPETAKDASSWVVRYFIRHWQLYDFGAWALIDKETKKLVGHGGLKYLPHTPPQEIDIFYLLDRPYWGKGLATEVGRAFLDYGFEKLSLDHIAAITRPKNTASQHVLEKLGMVYAKEAYYYGVDVLYYSISRAAYDLSNLKNAGSS